MSCGKCKGTGRVTYRTLGDLEPTDIGNGVTVQDVGGFGTRACECVRDLPAIDGKSTWWESESIYNEVVLVPIFDEAVEVTADCEVPRMENGQRVHRTHENSYYPPLIRVESPEAVTLHSDSARELAAALIAAADACDKADELASSTQPKDDKPLREIPF